MVASAIDRLTQKNVEMTGSVCGVVSRFVEGIEASGSQNVSQRLDAIERDLQEQREERARAKERETAFEAAQKAQSDNIERILGLMSRLAERERV